MVTPPSDSQKKVIDGYLRRLHDQGRQLTFRYEEGGEVQDAGGDSSVRVIKVGKGTSGTDLSGGYFNEEYLTSLQGTEAARTFDKMRRGESQIAMILRAMMNPIRSSEWFVEPPDDSDLGKEMAAFLAFNYFEAMPAKPWQDFLTEALGFIAFGYSAFEVVHQLIENHPKFGSFHGLGNLAWRSQKTIEEWTIDPSTGALLKVRQLATGDLESDVEIPGEHLLVFSLDKEGDNYEGISGIRAAYGPWFRKQEFLKLQAIGIEKFSVPMPIGKYPEGKFGTAEWDNFIAVLEDYVTNEKQYIVIPQGDGEKGDWDIELKSSDYDPSKTQSAIDAEDRNMAKSVVATMLELGMGDSNSGGSYAMSFDKSDLFLGGIEFLANIIADGLNRRVGPDLIKMKYGPQESYPKIRHSGIRDRVSKEWAEAVVSLASAGYLQPDDRSEEMIRKKLHLPPLPEHLERGETVEETTPGGSPPGRGEGEPGDDDPEAKEGTPPPEEPEEEPNDSEEIALTDPVHFQFAEKDPASLISKGAQELRNLMQANLRVMSGAVVKRVMAQYRKASGDQRATAHKRAKSVGFGGYQSILSVAFVDLGNEAARQVRKEVPSKAKVQLADDLPSKAKKRALAAAALVAKTQRDDLEKAIYFRFASSVDSTDSESQIEADLKEAGEDYVTSSSVIAASGNEAAKVVNNARNAFLFDQEVVDAIESLTFMNRDPVSEICQDLNGITFPVDDPGSARYHPPLHHNCKSYLRANLTGNPKNPKDVKPLRPSSPELEDDITLSDKGKK